MTTPAERAWELARDQWPTNPALQRAYVNGYLAGHGGRSLDSCPYTSGVRRRARAGWRPAWRSVWTQGWSDGDRARRAA